MAIQHNLLSFETDESLVFVVQKWNIIMSFPLILRKLPNDWNSWLQTCQCSGKTGCTGRTVARGNKHKISPKSFSKLKSNRLEEWGYRAPKPRSKSLRKTLLGHLEWLKYSLCPDMQTVLRNRNHLSKISVKKWKYSTLFYSKFCRHIS